MMTSHELQDLLHDLLDTLIEARERGGADADIDPDMVDRAKTLVDVSTYDAVGMLSTDSGLVVR